jgi:hypothetical protein
LRQTKMFKLSPGPMRYSADGSEEAGGAGGNSGAPPHPATDNVAPANKAPRNVRRTFCSRLSNSNSDEYCPRQVLAINTMIVDHPFAVGY